jgi:hypothetical protein
MGTGVTPTTVAMVAAVVMMTATAAMGMLFGAGG